jgi:hypothetical protein
LFNCDQAKVLKEYWLIETDTFNLGEIKMEEKDPYRRTIVEISKLLVERWLRTERGKKFSEDVNNAPGGMKEALQKAGISVAPWIKPVPDVGGFQGSITCDESVDPNIGLVLKWNIPFAPKPSEDDLSSEVLKNWITKCDEWLASEKPEDPNAPFPDPDNQYIPLATT